MKSQMEIEYEKYLNSDDIVIETEGKKYYKIITKHKLSINDGMVVICIPSDSLSNGVNTSVVDENGKIFELGGVSHFAFRNGIPRWYLETFTVNVKNIHETDEIGCYISVL